MLSQADKTEYRKFVDYEQQIRISHVMEVWDQGSSRFSAQQRSTFQFHRLLIILLHESEGSPGLFCNNSNLIHEHSLKPLPSDTVMLGADSNLEEMQKTSMECFHYIPQIHILLTYKIQSFHSSTPKSLNSRISLKTQSLTLNII